MLYKTPPLDLSLGCDRETSRWPRTCFTSASSRFAIGVGGGSPNIPIYSVMEFKVKLCTRGPCRQEGRCCRQLHFRGINPLIILPAHWLNPDEGHDISADCCDHGIGQKLLLPLQPNVNLTLCTRRRNDAPAWPYIYYSH